ncbi:pyridoxal phosphate-dependent transferase [Mycena albidolilacea]|uniref:Pyridoxal phosphate-dependent transferase n=1 Tax=Mycena albidolilacea TaxID=1033008 RepID=A0AAD6ZW64_9AGAR|nr:pyridoxal phosphate-dependent transferase [Mycena albidolilacea]
MPSIFPVASTIQPTPPVGHCVPPNTPHSVCNSLPEWHYTVAFATGKAELWLKDTVYPRQMVHQQVKRLIAVVVEALGVKEGDHCLLFPTRLLADECRAFIEAHATPTPCDVRCVTEIAHAPPPHQIFAVLFTADLDNVMTFYAFTGSAISSRLAELCMLRLAGDLRPTLGLPPRGSYFSEYYSRHSPLKSAEDAKHVIRRRFSGTLEGGVNIRCVPGASSNDVYLFSTGMKAIWRTHQLLHATVGSGTGSKKVAHVNLLYGESYKFLELKSSPGYYFFTDGTIDALEMLLATGTYESPAILALFTDFPGNPHLRTADMKRLRALANQYNFPIIVDETLGNYLNVQLFPYCDVVVSSLTKLFSGMGNVICGGMMLNPASQFYGQFKAHMEATYEDSIFDSDALVLEMNSREFVSRTAATNRNTEALADMLYSRSLAGGCNDSIIQSVHYPKYRNRENFDACRNPLAVQAGLSQTGYGSLLAVTFTSLNAAKIFLSALQCYKGTTLGCVYTLALAFNALAFPPEKKKWMEDHGAEENLVRFSVGTEQTESILKCVADALLVAEKVNSESCGE